MKCVCITLLICSYITVLCVHSTVAIFILQVVQLVLTVPLVGVAYYIVAVFGSCLQQSPLKDCTYKGTTGNYSIIIIMQPN